jgi:hypothetical protein
MPPSLLGAATALHGVPAVRRGWSTRWSRGHAQDTCANAPETRHGDRLRIGSTRGGTAGAQRAGVRRPSRAWVRTAVGECRDGGMVRAVLGVARRVVAGHSGVRPLDRLVVWRPSWRWSIRTRRGCPTKATMPPSRSSARASAHITSAAGTSRGTSSPAGPLSRTKHGNYNAWLDAVGYEVRHRRRVRPGSRAGAPVPHARARVLRRPVDRVRAGGADLLQPAGELRRPRRGRGDLLPRLARSFRYPSASSASCTGCTTCTVSPPPSASRSSQ